jgi:hypothetical protein
MFRTALRLGPGICLLAAAVAVAGFAPVPLWAAKPGTPPAVASSTGASAKPSDDDLERQSSLMAMGDFNRDGIADTAEITLPEEGHPGPAVLTVSLGRAGGSVNKITYGPVPGHNPQGIVAGDFNNDGIPDLIVGDDDGEMTLYLGDGTGRMVPAGDVAHLSSVVSMAVADFNHDGIPDVAVSDWRSSSVTVFLGTGKGSLRSGWSFPLRMGGTTPHLTVADFNGDGIPDLAVVYDNDDGDTYDVMLGHGNGTFTIAPTLGLVRDPNSHCAT